MRSKDILKTALLQFNGTLIVVSHDRDFLQGLTNRVFEFRHRAISEYIGDIYDFLEQRKLRDLSALEKANREAAQSAQEEEGSVNKAPGRNEKISTRRSAKCAAR